MPFLIVAAMFAVIYGLTASSKSTVLKSDGGLMKPVTAQGDTSAIGSIGLWIGNAVKAFTPNGDSVPTGVATPENSDYANALLAGTATGYGTGTSVGVLAPQIGVSPDDVPQLASILGPVSNQYDMGEGYGVLADLDE